MKKKSLKVFFCSALLAMVLTASACGGEDAGKENSEDSVQKEVQQEEDKEEAKEAPEETGEDVSKETPDTTEPAASEDATADIGIGKFPDVKAYVESDLVQEQLDAQLASLKDDENISMEVLGEADRLIYRYTMKTIAKTDALAEQLKVSMDGQTDTFKTVASSLKLAVEVENPVVVVEYLDMNGEVIYSAEYTAE